MSKTTKSNAQDNYTLVAAQPVAESQDTPIPQRVENDSAQPTESPDSPIVESIVQPVVDDTLVQPTPRTTPKASVEEMAAWFTKHAKQPDYARVKGAYVGIGLQMTDGKMWTFNAINGMLSFKDAADVLEDDTLVYSCTVQRLVRVGMSNQTLTVDRDSWSTSKFYFVSLNGNWHILMKTDSGTYRAIVSESYSELQQIALDHFPRCQAVFVGRVQKGEKPASIPTTLKVGQGYILSDFGKWKALQGTLSQKDSDLVLGVSKPKALKAK